MPTKDITTQQEIENLMQEGGPAAIIDFWAPWCGPCRAMAPHFEATAEAMKDEPVEFLKVNTEDHPDLSAAFNVRSLPTVVVVHNGEIQDVLVGSQNANSLERHAKRLSSRAKGEGFFKRLFG